MKMFRIECKQPNGSIIVGYSYTSSAYQAATNAYEEKAMSEGWDADFILNAIEIHISLFERKEKYDGNQTLTSL
jgi:hypothetical protein